MRILLLIALLFSLFRPAGVSAGLLYDQLTPFEKSYWLKLLHYKNGLSRADGEKFFLSPEGKSRPDLELLADREAFKDPRRSAGWFDYHPQCVFRERFEFLKKKGLLNGVQELPCEEFKKWKEGLNAESATLVFSSSYPNNPSSLFGHTLIRLNQKNKKEQSSSYSSDLLDYAVAFSAMPEKDDIGVVFAFKGMFGGYKGLLEVTKYYTKVMEYNNGESRDLIEYDLQMSEAELDALINHLWEIYQTTYFDYYFADENCSAVLADILAVPFAHQEVNQHEHWFYLPSEMIKVFHKFPGRIKSRHFRPSLKKQLGKRLEKLSSQDQKEVKSLFDSLSLPAEFNNTQVLDGVIALLDFDRYRNKDQMSTKQRSFMRTALVKRSKLIQEQEQESEKKEEVYDETNRPEAGHEPHKWSFFTRSEESHSLFGIEYKDGYHDLMGADEGFDPFSQFDFFTGSLVYDHALNKITYDQLTFVNLVSLHPYEFYDPQFSWAAKIVSDRLYDLDCELCHKINARAYLGPSLKPSSQMIFSLMSGVFGEVSSHFARGFRVGVGIEGSMLIYLTPKLKIGFFDEIRFNALGKIKNDYFHHITFKQSYFSSKNTEWRLESSVVSKKGSLSGKTWINQLNYGFYF